VWLKEAGPAEERQTYTAAEVREVVDLNDKRRYELRDTVVGKQTFTHVRALQGHSMRKVNALGRRLSLDPKADHGTDADGNPTVAAVPFAVHGTFADALDGEEGITKKGLHRMGRNQIHLAKGLLGDEDVVSGMRHDCEIFIWVDVHRAMRDGGLVFWETPNGVILCEGDESGWLPPAYFSSTIWLKGALAAKDIRKTARLRLIERLYAGASFVTVSKLHGGFSGSLGTHAATREPAERRAVPRAVSV
jgi:RNA:NAD 2'-phosphotransferase (TPT1/KptA family)